MPTKVCTICCKEKDLSDFPSFKRVSVKNGITIYFKGYCKDCNRSKKRLYHSKNKDHKNELRRIYRKQGRYEKNEREYRLKYKKRALELERIRRKDPEYKIYLSNKSKKYRLLHPEKVKESNKKQYDRKRLDPLFKAANVARAMRWAKENPDHHRRLAKECAKRRYKRNPELCARIKKQSRLKHPETSIKYNKKYVEELRDGHIKKLLRDNTPGLGHFPQELIEAKRLQIQIDRIIN